MFSRSFMMCKITLLLCLILTGHTAILAADEIWLSIDTSNATLLVKSGSRVVEKFNGIAIGRSGVTDRGMQGDDKTPLGTFRIAWINNNSRFHRFYGLNYPNNAHALSAYGEGLIDEITYDIIHTAIRSGRIPPQGTPLGGYVGIHGLGKADKRVHRLLNWTHGCVALTNQQIDRLSRWIKKGTKVVIY